MQFGRLRIHWAASRPPPAVASDLPDSLIHFRCSLCGARGTAPSRALAREVPSCDSCGSTVRFRAIGTHLLRALGLGVHALVDIPPRKDIVGLGLSDWPGYARLLAEKFTYENTYFHKAPQLNVCAPPPALRGTCDFLIASDVFEHVMPPVSRAFSGAAALLRPGGVLVLTVPYAPNAATVEHYPGARSYTAGRDGRVWIEHSAGRFQAPLPVFHGGPGATLEMRVFGSRDLQRELELAGFEDIVFHAEADLEAGILHRELSSLPITARKR